MGEIVKHPFDLKDKPEWLKLRRGLSDEGRLGGSDLGAAVGDNPYKSPYALWCEMVGLYEPDDISDKEAIKQGVMFEPAVAERFEKESGIEVEEVPFIFTNTDAPHLFATPDRLCKDGESGLECKTAKEIVMKKFPLGDFPQQYFDQCCCYLKVTERKRWYIAILVYGVAFNIYLMTTIKEEADRFNYLKNKVEGSSVLTPEESEEWKQKWNWLLAVYYVDKETLEGCEIAAANFIARVDEGKAGNMDVWPLEEIDGSESTSKAIALAAPKTVTNSVVKFDDSEDYGVANDGNVFTEARGCDIVRLVGQRLEYEDIISQLRKEMEELDNRLARIMKDKEKFIIPGCSIVYKEWVGKERGDVAAIKNYFAGKNMKVPEGLITRDANSRGVRYYKKKRKKI